MDVKQTNGSHLEHLSEGKTESHMKSKPKRGLKLYQKPAFRFERIFETNALSCGKMSATQFQCGLNLKTS